MSAPFVFVVLYCSLVSFTTSTVNAKPHRKQSNDFLNFSLCVTDAIETIYDVSETTTLMQQQDCGDRYCPLGQYCVYNPFHTGPTLCATPEEMCDGDTYEFSLCPCRYACGEDNTVACHNPGCRPGCQCKSGLYVQEIPDSYLCVSEDACIEKRKRHRKVKNKSNTTNPIQ